MDRISALRNVETALTEFEEGEIDLDGLERQVRAVLRTYATDFEDDRTAVYAVAPTAEREVVVVAGSPGEARSRAAEIADVDCDGATVERLSEGATGGGAGTV